MKDWQAITKRFNTDPRVIASRKQYRIDLKNGIAERDAWKRQKLVVDTVLRELNPQA